MGEGKDATDLTQLNTQNLRYLLGYPRDLIKSQAGCSRANNGSQRPYMDRAMEVIGKMGYDTGGAGSQEASSLPLHCHLFLLALLRRR